MKKVKLIWGLLLIAFVILIVIVVFPRINRHSSTLSGNSRIVNIVGGDGNVTHNILISDNDRKDSWTINEIIGVGAGILGSAVSIIQLTSKKGESKSE